MASEPKPKPKPHPKRDQVRPDEKDSRYDRPETFGKGWNW